MLCLGDVSSLRAPGWQAQQIESRGPQKGVSAARPGNGPYPPCSVVQLPSCSVGYIQSLLLIAALTVREVEMSASEC